ncbi:LysR family transcriptional regulator [Buttiauxella sp.]|uniref:LysR family transcriptional regulator n=1 Tax=Buttiauxella sp. TaxID=1972222 RepID=UPI003C7374B0
MYKHYQDMALFASLAAAGSFTKVATQFNLPKSRVSQRINALEEMLGIRLLNRTTRRVSLTSAGEKYLYFCNEMLEIGAKADEFIQLITARPAGKLRIIAPAGLMISSLSKWNHDFLKANPEVNIEVLTADSFFGSVEGAFDIAFRVGKPVEQSYIGRLLGEYERLLVASPEYLKSKSVRHPKDLNLLDLHIHKTWKKLNLTKDDEVVSLQDNPRQVTDNLPYLLQCALQGSGVAVLPRYFIQQYLDASKLQIVLPEWTIEKVDIWMVYPSSRNNSLILKNYVDFVMKSGVIDLK